MARRRSRTVRVAWPRCYAAGAYGARRMRGTRRCFRRTSVGRASMTTVPLDFTAIDFETANSSAASACSVGLVKVRDGRVVDRAGWLIRPPLGHDEFHEWNTRIHGIRADGCRGCRRLGRAAPRPGRVRRGRPPRRAQRRLRHGRDPRRVRRDRPSPAPSSATSAACRSRARPTTSTPTGSRSRRWRPASRTSTTTTPSPTPRRAPRSSSTRRRRHDAVDDRRTRGAPRRLARRTHRRGASPPERIRQPMRGFRGSRRLQTGRCRRPLPH